MFEIASTLHPVRQRRFRQYAAFLRSVGASDDSFAVVPAGRLIPAEVRVTYGLDKFNDGDLLTQTSVVTGGREFIFTSGLDRALFHLSWYFDANRGPLIARAMDMNDLAATIKVLDLGEDDVAIDGDGRRSGYIIRRRPDEAQLVLVETYGEVVPIASSPSASVLAYLVRCFNDLQTSDIVERTAEFLPND